MKKAAPACLDERLPGVLLDMGCGPRPTTREATSQLSGIETAGLDIVPAMIRVSTERLGARAEISVLHSNWFRPILGNGQGDTIALLTMAADFMPGAGFLALRVRVDVAEEFGKQLRA
jgi:hypothetical protein